MRGGSKISTTAGTAGAGGDGGNIAINAKFIVAVPDENSDITANAFSGRGGRIEIATQGLFGIEDRDRPTPLSDITASSEFGVQGQVTIAQPDLDPSQTLVQFPINLVDPSQQIARGCPSQGRITEKQLGSFVITGRGGLPPSPTDPRISEVVLTDWATLETEEENEAAKIEAEVTREETSQAILEAQGWTIGQDGKLVLVAQAPTVTPYLLLGNWL